MHRRAFARHLLVAGLAAPAVLTGSAISAVGGHDNGHIGLPPFDHVTLRLPQGRTTVRWFMILTDDAVYGIDLRQEVPQMPAERLDLGAIPLLGQILTPTLERQFADATPFGSLYLAGHALILLPEAQWSPQRLRVRITHRKVVYRPAAGTRKLKASSAPDREEIEATRPVGAALLNNDVLLGIVPPSRLERLLRAGTPARV